MIEAGENVALAVADSVESFETLVQNQQSATIGIRVRHGTSRFGIELNDYRVFQRLVACARSYAATLRFGVHMHVASDVVGPSRWFDLLKHTLTWADAVSQSAGVEVSMFDVGGGWHPEDFREIFLPALADLQTNVVRALPSVSTLLIEPGKAISSEGAWLATRILELRAGAGDSFDVVVDA